MIERPFKNRSIWFPFGTRIFLPLPRAALEETQGQMDGFLSQHPRICGELT
jgi:hypothetical protein